MLREPGQRLFEAITLAKSKGGLVQHPVAEVTWGKKRVFCTPPLIPYLLCVDVEVQPVEQCTGSC